MIYKIGTNNIFTPIEGVICKFIENFQNFKNTTLSHLRVIENIFYAHCFSKTTDITHFVLHNFRSTISSKVLRDIF